MKINNLVGVSAGINGGKDLVGEMVQYISAVDTPTYKGFENEDYPLFSIEYEIKKCAEKLKEIVAIVIGCNRADLEDEVFKNTPLGKEWERYALKTVYTPFPLDSESNECYIETEYHSTEEAAQFELSNLLKIYGANHLSGDIVTEVLTPRKVLQLLGTQGGRKEVHPNIWVNSLFSDWKPRDKGVVSDNLDYTHVACFNCNKQYDGAKRQYLCNECIEDDSVQIYPKWVITDVRFPENEGAAVTKRNGLLIGIRRKFILKFPQYSSLQLRANEDEYSIPMALRKDNIELWKSLTHDSESSMGDYSWCDVVIENNGTIEELFNKVLKALS